MFRGAPKEEKGKRLRGGTFRKTSHKTGAVVSHSGTHSQISVRSVSLLSSVLTKPLKMTTKFLEREF